MADTNEIDSNRQMKQKSDPLLEKLAVKMQEVRRKEEDLSNMRKALEDERRELENDKKRFRLEQEDFYDKRNVWEKDYRKKSDSLELIERNMEKVKQRIEMERREIDMDLRKIETERRMLEEENDIILSKRAMLEEERKTLEREKKLLKNREDSLDKMREQLREASELPSTSRSLYEDTEKESAGPPESLPEPEKKAAPLPKRPGPQKKKEKTMACFNCGAEVVIPEGAEKVTCSVCSKEYTIRTARAGDADADLAVSRTPVPSRSGAGGMRELSDGRVEVTCENQQCGNKFIVDDPTSHRVHCPVCGRRMRMH